MSVTGYGRTLGEALLAGFRQLWLRRKPAKGWHARLRQLTATSRGQELLAGETSLSSPGRTTARWAKWLSEDWTPAPVDQTAIARAYRRYLGMPAVQRGKNKITGVVAIGHDVRHRGRPPHAPLLIDHRNGIWGPIERAWVMGIDAGELETLYIDNVIMMDLDFSQDPEFPGDAYEVELIS